MYTKKFESVICVDLDLDEIETYSHSVFQFNVPKVSGYQLSVVSWTAVSVYHYSTRAEVWG